MQYIRAHTYIQHFMKIYGDILYVEKRYCYFNRIQNYLNPLVDQINCVYTRRIYFIKWVTIKIETRK